MYEEIHLDSEWHCAPCSLRERNDGQSARGEKRKQHDNREGIASPFYQDRNEDEHQCYNFAYPLNAKSELRKIDLQGKSQERLMSSGGLECFSRCFSAQLVDHSGCVGVGLALDSAVFTRGHV
jgi:hypothetical protein